MPRKPLPREESGVPFKAKWQRSCSRAGRRPLLVLALQYCACRRKTTRLAVPAAASGWVGFSWRRFMGSSCAAPSTSPWSAE